MAGSREVVETTGDGGIGGDRWSEMRGDRRWWLWRGETERFVDGDLGLECLVRCGERTMLPILKMEKRTLPELMEAWQLEMAAGEEAWGARAEMEMRMWQ